jgi:hypothetical protein
MPALQDDSVQVANQPGRDDNRKARASSRTPKKEGASTRRLLATWLELFYCGVKIMSSNAIVYPVLLAFFPTAVNLNK